MTQNPTINNHITSISLVADLQSMLVERGVIDPTKVVRTALQNAASVSGLLLTTRCVIVDEPGKKEEHAGHGHHGHAHGHSHDHAHHHPAAHRP